MSSSPSRPVFTLLQDSPNFLERSLIPPLDWFLGLQDLERLYQRIRLRDPEVSFFTRTLDLLQVQRRYPTEILERIPAQGPLVVVANHPFGALEGLVLMELLQRRRRDVRVLGNLLLSVVPEVAEHTLPVDTDGGPKGRVFNIPSMRKALHWVHSGGVLAVFPAGEVSHFVRGARHCVDTPWSPTLAKLIARLGAPVLPVHFRGTNSLVFHLLGKIHPSLRTLRLPRELLNKRGKRVHWTLGEPIPPSQLHAIGNASESAEYLRFRTYLLEPPRPSPVSLVPPFLHPKEPPLASAVPEGMVEEEVRALGDGSLLCASGRFEVRLAEARHIPGALREIGRLREVTFRACGEGTGKPLDLDLFDHHYLHLLLWDKEARQIAGAYRMGLTDEILTTKGIRGLYTSTLFRFAEPFFSQLGPALEMGRSFIRPEYQKGYQPLLLLWKAIARYSALHPRYRRLFGVVSMSNDYRNLSKALVVRHLRRHHHHPTLAPWAQARHPFQMDPARLLKIMPRETWDQDIEEVSRWVSQLEGDGKGVPVLIRHYLKLGARFTGFNVDPKFNRALDALMVVDLDLTDPGRLERYRTSKGRDYPSPITPENTRPL